MFDNTVKIQTEGCDEVVTIETSYLVLEALCAYRDKLVMSEDGDRLERITKGIMIRGAIDEVLSLRQS